jgi:pimeloyl-ACP methyl ester carboxylesterase
MNYAFVILLCMVGIGILVISYRYKRDIMAARMRVGSLGSQVIQTACGPIEYARVGKGYPVLVVHGAMGGFDQGLWLAHGFDISNHQVISVSRFGYLRTPLPPGANLDQQADAFACLLDALEIRRAAVFAVSAGSTSAIRFAARHPERVSGLILLSPDAPGSIQITMPPMFVFDTLLRSDFVYWALVTFFGSWVQNMTGMVPKGYVLTPEYKAQIKMIQLGDLPVSQRVDGMIFESYTTLADYNATVTADSPYPLNKMITPVLVIHPVDDPIVAIENVRGLAEQIPNTRMFIVPDGGHFLFGHREEVKAEIAEFLRNNGPELENGK